MAFDYKKEYKEFYMNRKEICNTMGQVQVDHCVITVNAYSYTIVTAHKE